MDSLLAHSAPPPPLFSAYACAQMNIQIKKTQPGQYGGCNGRAQMTRFNKCLEYAELIIGYTSKMSGAHQEEDFNRHKSKLLFRSFTHMQYALGLQYFKGSLKHATLMQGLKIGN